MTTVAYTAAHAGFAPDAPLGGGAAIANRLAAEWSRTRPFALELLTPTAVLGDKAPSGRDITRFSEREYARFCHAFSDASTHRILQHDPRHTVVLSNDVSEAPDFARLAAAGYRIFTIYHVDVVDYISAIYLRSIVKPETAVRWFERFRALAPAILQLIFAKQRDSLRYSHGVIVPSAGMRDVILRCYPETPAERIHVVPWGVDLPPADGDSAESGIAKDRPVLLTLSRLSPEKGQDLLLRALAHWDGEPLTLVIAGEAAYMHGIRFAERLKRLAAKLKRIRVVFPGHVTGARKQALFAGADLYVFPSRHESYGLTLLEAFAAGLPALALDHHGARSVMRPEFGAMVKPGEMLMALKRLLADRTALRAMGEAARQWALTQPASASAARLAALLQIYSR